MNDENRQYGEEPGTDPAGRSPEEIESEIRRTRADMAETISELEHKLQPKVMARDAAGAMGEKGREVAMNVRSKVMANPMPWALIGAGAAWLMISRRRAGGAEYGWDSEPWSDRQVSSGGKRMRETLEEGSHRVSEATAEARERVREGAHVASERVREGAHVAGERLREYGAYTRDKAMAARDSLTEMLHEQPFLVAGIGFALGAAVGALVPTTEIENRKLGPMRDQALDKAAEVGQEQLEKAQRVAKTAGEAAKEQARREFETGQGGEPHRPS